ncbi:MULTISPECIES: hypothetical protein [unclassified Variovorax]|uniref:hypothetical protein n=1 Tax=unclassified Variovorax TaxID=663243 RepID=UPI000837AE8D|nr:MULTISPECIES: hypothetical protein [unclassified Variovorax]
MHRRRSERLEIQKTAMPSNGLSVPTNASATFLGTFCFSRRLHGMQASSSRRDDRPTACG